MLPAGPAPRLVWAGQAGCQERFRTWDAQCGTTGSSTQAATAAPTSCAKLSVFFNCCFRRIFFCVCGKLILSLFVILLPSIIIIIINIIVL